MSATLGSDLNGFVVDFDPSLVNGFAPIDADDLSHLPRLVVSCAASIDLAHKILVAGRVL